MPPFFFSPILDTMIDLYQKPRSTERFREYLNILQGNSKDDMMVPVGNFNPMGKEHVLEKLIQLKNLKAEELMESTLSDLNHKIKEEFTFRVSLAVADDLKGAWTNHYTTDYDSKFKLNAFVTRHFCTPLFWTSENYTEDMIRQRTQQYCYRTLYWQLHPKPKTLKEHILQEAFVADKMNYKTDEDLSELKSIYEREKDTDNYSIIFNFLYGDDACKELGFPSYGIKEKYSGYKFAAAFIEDL